MKNNLMIVSICLVILMSLSIVSAGWFSGNVPKEITEDDNKINIYNDEEREIEVNGIVYEISDVRINEDEIHFLITNTETTNGAYFNSGTDESGEGVIDSLKIETVMTNKGKGEYVSKPFWKKNYRARLEISEIEAYEEPEKEGIKEVSIFLNTKIVDGEFELQLLQANESDWVIGKNSEKRLAISKTTTLFYQAQLDYNDGFITSNDDTKESYYLEAFVSRDAGGARKNRTSIKNKLTGNYVCQDLSEEDICTIGNVELTVMDVNYVNSGNRDVTFNINSNGSFNRLYSTEGLRVIYFNI